MRYIRIDTNFWQHPKTLRFCRLMKDQNAAAYLIRLWSWAAGSSRDGNVSLIGQGGLEIVAGCPKAKGKCYAAMVTAGFVDESQPGVPLKLHNWELRFSSSNRKTIAHGPTWSKQRYLALIRDRNSCVRCGDANAVEVHHVTPIRLFNGDTETGNALSNLLCLCEECHQDERAAPLRAV